MAKRQLQLTEHEIGQLAAAEEQTDDKRARIRYQAMRLYGQGWAIRTIQEVTLAGESTIRQWAMAYRAEGLAGLESHWSGKNASKLTDEQRAQVKARLHQNSPADVGISQGQFWSVSDLQVAVFEWFGVTYQDKDSYQHLLRQCGFSYQRSAKVYRHRPSEADIAAFESALEKK